MTATSSFRVVGKHPGATRFAQTAGVAIAAWLVALCGCLKDLNLPNVLGGGGPTIYSPAPSPSASPTASDCHPRQWFIGPINSLTRTLELTVGFSRDVSVWNTNCPSSMVASVAWEPEHPSVAAVVILGNSHGVITGSASGATMLTARIALVDGSSASVQASVLVRPLEPRSPNSVLITAATVVITGRSEFPFETGARGMVEATVDWPSILDHYEFYVSGSGGAGFGNEHEWWKPALGSTILPAGRYKIRIDPPAQSGSAAQTVSYEVRLTPQ